MIFPVVTESDRRLPFCLLGVGCEYAQEHVIRPNGYPSFQWIQCYQGRGELVLGAASYVIAPQQGMFLFPNVPHEYYALDGPWQVDWISLGGSQIAPLVLHLGFEQSGVFQVSQSDRLLGKLRRILNTALSGNIFNALECSSLVYELLIELYKNISPGSEASMAGRHLKLQPVMEFLEKNYAGSITLPEMAEIIRVTPQYLCYLFKTFLKVRPFEYLNQLRLTKSKDLLIKHRNLKIADIARKVGFDNVNYFCYLFRKVEGMTPGAFRKLYGI